MRFSDFIPADHSSRVRNVKHCRLYAPLPSIWSVSIKYSTFLFLQRAQQIKVAWLWLSALVLARSSTPSFAILSFQFPWNLHYLQSQLLHYKITPNPLILTISKGAEVWEENSLTPQQRDQYWRQSRKMQAMLLETAVHRVETREDHGMMTVPGHCRHALCLRQSDGVSPGDDDVELAQWLNSHIITVITHWFSDTISHQINSWCNYNVSYTVHKTGLC